MEAMFSLVAAAALSACASTSSVGVDPGWAAYRAHEHEALVQGAVSPVEAQELIRSSYRETYGMDPVMEGAFVYGLKLYEAADQGALTLQEADQLAQQRIGDAFVHRKWRRPRYQFPPEASD
jgi:hypothetical protein